MPTGIMGGGFHNNRPGNYSLEARAGQEKLAQRRALERKRGIASRLPQAEIMEKRTRAKRNLETTIANLRAEIQGMEEKIEATKREERELKANDRKSRLEVGVDLLYASTEGRSRFGSNNSLEIAVAERLIEAKRKLLVGLNQRLTDLS